MKRMSRITLVSVVLGWMGCASTPTPVPEGATLPVAEKATTGPRAEGDLLSNTHQLVFEGKRSGEGYFSKDGTSITFQSERDAANPFYQIYHLDLETGDTVRVSPGIGKTTCSWIHPDGRSFLFASTHEDPDAQKEMQAELEFRASGQTRRYSWDYDEFYDVYAGPAGGPFTNLTHTRGYDAEGSYSPDGQWIVFASNRSAFEGTLSAEDKAGLEHDPAYMMEIYRMKADGSQVSRLTHSPGYDGGPFFSPDGKSITWRRFSPDGHTAEVWVMDVDGSNPRQLTQLGAMSWAPYFHPSGDYLIFTTNLQGFQNFELYLVDAAGSREPVRVTFTEGFDGLPVFSPDGQHLLWSTNRTADKVSQLFMSDWNDARARELLALSPPRGQTQAITPAPAAKVGDLSGKDVAITAEDLRRYVEFLASDGLEGRLTGTSGEISATAFVGMTFEKLGLLPAGSDSWYQPFDFRSGVEVEPSSALAMQGSGAPESLMLDTDWRPLSFSKAGSVGFSEVVFAGYGIVAPKIGGQAAYDSYQGLDVKDKWVLVLRFMPESIPQERRTHLSRYASLRYKAMEARDRGARGILVVSGPGSKARNQLIPLGLDASASDVGIAAVTLTDGVGERLIKGAEKGLAEVQAALDTGEESPGFVLPGVKLGGHLALKFITSSGRNVVGRLQVGETPSAEVVIIGAHVDHLGRGQGSDSLARDDEKGQIHHGADDNASGVAGMLEIAQWLVDQKASGKLSGARRDVVFVAWSGEELGLLGSNYFVKHYGGVNVEPTTLRPGVAAYLNMDMIGRRNGPVVLQGIGSSPAWPGLIERANIPVGLPLQLSDSTYLPTDATPFYLKGVPILAAFTGAHGEYHTPRDTADRLDYDSAASISRLIGNVGRSLVLAESAPEYVLKVKTTQDENRRVGRIYLGTIPDYAAGEVKGLKISGAAAEGPAAKAGLQAGDIIVELAGKPIENIYDYMKILDTLKIGEKTTIVVERQGQRLPLTIVPGSRE